VGTEREEERKNVEYRVQEQKKCISDLNSFFVTEIVEN
jgi:hypothetical protein